ncbi:unnamed protein product [Symbiodinium natans]|uniref:Uncharacterized protein n=1 Tax=Symbiodinium natans TaxID=878477 RepID=A0A812TSJ6_9DINO|nr:unnamed protein product [Symbiodinium natans]
MAVMSALPQPAGSEKREVFWSDSPSTRTSWTTTSEEASPRLSGERRSALEDRLWKSQEQCRRQKGQRSALRAQLRRQHQKLQSELDGETRRRHDAERKQREAEAEAAVRVASVMQSLGAAQRKCQDAEWSYFDLCRHMHAQSALLANERARADALTAELQAERSWWLWAQEESSRWCGGLQEQLCSSQGRVEELEKQLRRSGDEREAHVASCRRLQEENLQLAKRLQELQTESQEQTAPQPNSRKSLGGESASTATTCEGPQSDPESGGESEDNLWEDGGLEQQSPFCKACDASSPFLQGVLDCLSVSEIMCWRVTSWQAWDAKALVLHLSEWGSFSRSSSQEPLS